MLPWWRPAPGQLLAHKAPRHILASGSLQLALLKLCKDQQISPGYAKQQWAVDCCYNLFTEPLPLAKHACQQMVFLQILVSLLSGRTLLCMHVCRGALTRALTLHAARTCCTQHVKRAWTWQMGMLEVLCACRATLQSLQWTSDHSESIVRSSRQACKSSFQIAALQVSYDSSSLQLHLLSCSTNA